MKTIFTISLSIILLVSGCSEVAGHPGPSESSSESPTDIIRQTDDSGKRLPFVNYFPNRWNSHNSGSQYEPCTNLYASDLDALQIDRDSLREAAKVDGQSLRGCAYSYTATAGKRLKGGQIVINSESLASYKRRNAVASKWHADVYIKGRQVGVNETMGGCLTYVQSKGAGVLTDALATIDSGLTIQQVCDRALDVTMSTIENMPK